MKFGSPDSEKYTSGNIFMYKIISLDQRQWRTFAMKSVVLSMASSEFSVALARHISETNVASTSGVQFLKVDIKRLYVLIGWIPTHLRKQWNPSSFQYRTCTLSDYVTAYPLHGWVNSRVGLSVRTMVCARSNFCPIRAESFQQIFFFAEYMQIKDDI